MKVHVLVNPRNPTGLMNRVDPFAVHGYKYIKHLSPHFQMIHYGIPGAQVDCEHVDIPTTPTEIRKFNELAGALNNTVVLCVSADLPFAQKRFCGAEGITNVQNASSFRTNFGDVFGVTLVDSALKGLLARAVVVINESGQVTHTELVDEIANEPNYDAALAALK